MRAYAKYDLGLSYPHGEVSDTDDALDDDTEEKVDVDEEDDLIKALKVAREKKTRNSPPGIETTRVAVGDFEIFDFLTFYVFSQLICTHICFTKKKYRIFL